jgi:hypothetical protein
MHAQVVTGITGLMINEEAVRKYVCNDDEWRNGLIDLLKFRENFDADTPLEEIFKLLEVVTYVFYFSIHCRCFYTHFVSARVDEKE